MVGITGDATLLLGQERPRPPTNFPLSGGDRSWVDRGDLHLRLDALAPPPTEFTVELLARAIREAADQVVVPLPQFRGGPVRLARWGSQLDLRPIESRGELTAEAVAGYIAKYATKATEDFGPALDRRLKEDEIEGLVVPPHVH